MYGCNTRKWPPALVGYLAVAGIALAARLWGFESESIYYDELTTLSLAALPFGELIGQSIRFGQGPLYYLSLKPLLAIGIDPRIAALAINIVSGTISAPLASALALRNGIGRPAALAAGLLAASSPMLVCQAQEARPYSLLVLLGLAVAYLYQTARLRFRRILLGATAMIMFALVHPAASVFLAALFFAAAIELFRSQAPSRPGAAAKLAGLAPAGLLGMVIAIYASGSLKMQPFFDRSYPGPLFGLPLHFVYAGAAYSADSMLLKRGPHLDFDPASLLGLLVLYGVIVVGLFERRPGPSRGSKLALLIFYILAGVLSYRFPLLIEPKYTIFCYPLLYIIAASGAFRRGAKFGVVIIGILLALNIRTLVNRLERPDLPQWREAAEFVEQNSQPYEKVIGLEQWNRTLVAHYYKQPNLASDKDILFLESATAPASSALWIVSRAKVGGAPSGGNHLKFASKLSGYSEPELLMKKITEAYPDCSVREFFMVEAYHCQPNTTAFSTGSTGEIK